MLEHDNLEQYRDPVNYDIEDSSDTGVAFYTDLAQETGGPVLEIACGTGRVAIPIARQGYEVTGLDIVPEMLEQARRKSAGLPVSWVQGDARSFDLGKKFRLIYLTGNAFQAFLTRADQEALFERVRTHLSRQGLFAFETRNPRWPGVDNRPLEPGVPVPVSRAEKGPLFAYLETRLEEQLSWIYTDSHGRRVRIYKTQAYDPITQILHWTSYRRWREGGHERTKRTRLAVRFVFPQELEALLHYNGFSIWRRYGDWDLQPLASGSPSLIVVCRQLRA